MKGIVYDCETKKCVPGGGHPIPGLDYCLGWKDFKGMGISVIGVYEIETNCYRVFLDDNLKEFEKLANESEHIIGFNSLGFDDLLCQANGIKIKTTYDLLREVRLASGQPAEYVRGKTKAGYSLGALAFANLGKQKEDCGNIAPILWQQGNLGKLVDYCLNDVQLTAKLWLRSYHSGILIDPTNKEKLKMPKLAFSSLRSQHKPYSIGGLLEFIRSAPDWQRHEDDDIDYNEVIDWDKVKD